MTELAGSRVLVLGLGVSGEAAAQLALSKGASVTVLDHGVGPQLEMRADTLRGQGATVHLGQTDHTPTADLVVISPGVSPDSKLGRLAAVAPCEAIGELEFGFRACACPIVAITGTNGKTTTTELTTHLLTAAGRRVAAAGNIGVPLSAMALISAELDFLVVEVSSFQLERAPTFAPLAAAFLNCSPDHMNRYRDFTEYLETKCRILSHLPSPERAVVGLSLLETAALQRLQRRWGAPPVTVSPSDTTATWHMADGQLCSRRDGAVQPRASLASLQLVGRHNVENALTALALCEAAGVPMTEAVSALTDFAPSAHRLELVAMRNGVRYVNDSKATNPDALIQGVSAVVDDPRLAGRRVRLIAGGRDKGMDFAAALPVLQAHVGSVYLIGETQTALASLWGASAQCQACDSLEAAVEAACRDAEPGEVVLLSPGCASHDMFSDYMDRGNRFSCEVRRRLGEAT